MKMMRKNQHSEQKSLFQGEAGEPKESKSKARKISCSLFTTRLSSVSLRTTIARPFPLFVSFLVLMECDANRQMERRSGEPIIDDDDDENTKKYVVYIGKYLEISKF